MKFWCRYGSNKYKSAFTSVSLYAAIQNLYGILVGVFKYVVKEAKLGGMRALIEKGNNGSQKKSRKRCCLSKLRRTAPVDHHCIVRSLCLLLGKQFKFYESA